MNHYDPEAMYTRKFELRNRREARVEDALRRKSL